MRKRSANRFRPRAAPRRLQKSASPPTEVQLRVMASDVLWVPITEAARRLGFSVKTLKRRRDEGRLEIVKTAREADDIANLAFISGETNQKISDKPPSEYMKAMREKVGSGPFQSQAIPVDDELLELERYEDFLIRRRELVADRLNALLWG